MYISRIIQTFLIDTKLIRLSKISRGFENRKILENLDENTVRIQEIGDFF